MATSEEMKSSGDSLDECNSCTQENFPKKHDWFFEWELCKFPFTNPLLENPNTYH